MCRNAGHAKELFAKYVKERTEENWKFYIVSFSIRRSIFYDVLTKSFPAVLTRDAANAGIF